MWRVGVLAWGLALAACDDAGGGLITFDGDGFDDGKVTIGGSPEGWNGRAVAGPEGSLYVYGHHNSGASDAASNGTNLVIKLRADGRPDPTFATGGVFTMSDAYSEWHDAASAADGSLVLIVNDPRGPLVHKLRPDGVLDPTFGTDGEVVLPTRGFDGAEGHTVGLDVMIDVDGTAVVTGVFDNTTTSRTFAIRLGSAGETIARAAYDVTGDSWGEVLPDGGGGTLVFGSRYIDLATYPLVGRLGADLALDENFGGGTDYAKVGSTPGGFFPVVARPGGYAAASAGQIVALDANGEPVTGFSSEATTDYITSIATDSAGRLLVQVMGHLDSSPSPPPEYVTRLGPDGAIDLSYGLDGKSQGTAVQAAGIVIGTNGTSYAVSDDWPTVVLIRRLPQ